tara:strand:- start:1296 stop:2942 length:1647 start_codon:yes stop_codon:yes gene_type:complete
MANEIYINVGGTWKTVTDYYVNVSGTWKTGTQFDVKVSSDWKGGESVSDVLPTFADVMGLDYVDWSLPAAFVNAKSTIDSANLDYVDWSLPIACIPKPAALSTPSLVITNLVLYLNASNSSSYSGSGTTWSDLSGSSNNGTLTNGVTYSSDNGGVLVFDGTDDYLVTGSDMFNANNDFTVSIWLLIDDTSVQRAFIADVDNSQSLFLRYNNGIQLVNSNTAVLGSFSSSTLTTNIWYNLTLTRSSNTYTLYVNGSSVSSLYGITQTFTHSPTTIGANKNNTPPPDYKNNFDGKIAQVLAYSSTLTASQILQNYNATKSNYTVISTNLILHLDTTNSSSYSGSGTTWTDLSGEGNHATLVNSPGYFTNTGGYFSFDGSNDYATLPNMDLTGNELTFSIWTYAQSDTAASLIFLGDSTASHGNGRIIQVHLPYSGNYYFDKGHDGSSSASYDRINGSLANSDWQNAWVNWTFTANASTGSMKIYRNASLYASGTGKTKTFSNSDGDMKYIAHSGTAYYDGYISKILLYKKELSASEVLHNYNIDKALYGH